MLQLEYDQNIIYQKEGMQGHVCEMSNFFNQDVVDEYGRLFSAAPELLDALQWVNEEVSIYNSFHPDNLINLTRVLSAIQKATKGNLITT